MKDKSTLRTELMVLCDYASVSKEGKLSINGIFDEVRVSKFPGGLARAFIVATVSGTPETLYKLTFKLEYNGKDLIPPHNLETRTGLNGKNNMIVEFVGISFPEPGDYDLRMYHGDDEMSLAKLKVIHIKQMPN